MLPASKASALTTPDALGGNAFVGATAMLFCRLSALVIPFVENVSNRSDEQENP